MAGNFEYGNEPSGSIKIRQIYLGYGAVTVVAARNFV